MEVFESIQKHFAWIFAALSLTVAIIAIWLNIRKGSRRFSCKTLLNTPLISQRKEAADKIQNEFC